MKVVVFELIGPLSFFVFGTGRLMIFLLEICAQKSAQISEANDLETLPSGESGRFSIVSSFVP